MFYNIIFSLISTFILVGFIYFDKTTNDEKEMGFGEIIKYFLVIFIINLMLSILLVQMMKSDYLNMPVELDLID
jgi:RsiW-degrading membrane proteinase PrsW (M82 family)